MISFAGKVKNELCRVGISRQCCARAEGYGVLLYGNTFTPGEIRIITENGDFAARLPKLFQKAFGVKFDRVPEETNGKGKLIFGITAPEKLEKIINTLGYDARQLTALHVNFGILEEDCCRPADGGDGVPATFHTARRGCTSVLQAVRAHRGLSDEDRRTGGGHGHHDGQSG